MTLCLPFLMFQGQAQEAIDLYLETFPDAELLEIQHHPEGTEIIDSRPAEMPMDQVDEDEATLKNNGDGAGASGGETSPPTGTDLTTVDPQDDSQTPARLVATAQIMLGGQVLMIQDSLITHHFSFTPAVSVAVVVDTTAEFHQTVDSLSEGGTFLMEPGDYDFAKNFAWVQDRFGMSWQVNHPLTAPDENISQAQPPVWG